MKDRIELLTILRQYMLSDEPQWLKAKQRASVQNPWFIPTFVDSAITSICDAFLDSADLVRFQQRFQRTTSSEKTIGVVAAGNIPLVGFHDFLTVFLSPHRLKLKLSSKDDILLRHLIEQLYTWDSSIQNRIEIADMLRSCDAYIATGSNQSSTYFEQYFGKYPHIIRKHRTSIAILDGSESPSQLDALADDVYMYFGLGCRNVTHLYTPHGYSFEPLLQHFKKYDELKDHNKYRNNYDYNLALYILNGQYYMSNESILMVEHTSIFSPPSVLHYSYYQDSTELENYLMTQKGQLQGIVSSNHIPFGASQKPSLFDFADGVDTIDFMNRLS